MPLPKCFWLSTLSFKEIISETHEDETPSSSSLLTEKQHLYSFVQPRKYSRNS